MRGVRRGAGAAGQQAFARGKKAVYTCPVKALSNQKYAEFRGWFQAHGIDADVSLLTGDVQVCTPLPSLPLSLSASLCASLSLSFSSVSFCAFLCISLSISLSIYLSALSFQACGVEGNVSPPRGRGVGALSLFRQPISLSLSLTLTLTVLLFFSCPPSPSPSLRLFVLFGRGGSSCHVLGWDSLFLLGWGLGLLCDGARLPNPQTRPPNLEPRNTCPHGVWVVGGRCG